MYVEGGRERGDVFGSVVVWCRKDQPWALAASISASASLEIWEREKFVVDDVLGREGELLSMLMCCPVLRCPVMSCNVLFLFEPEDCEI